MPASAMPQDQVSGMLNSNVFLCRLRTPEELSTLQVEESEVVPEASTTGKSSASSSRFAYNMLTEDEAVKAPGVTRGKDGHVSLGSNDFFSDPLGSSAPGRK